MFQFPNRARALFKDRDLDAARIEAALAAAPLVGEPAATLDQLCERAAELAGHLGATDVNCLHLMVAISRAQDSEAHRLLERIGISLTTLRHVAVTHMTGATPRRPSGPPLRRRLAYGGAHAARKKAMGTAGENSGPSPEDGHAQSSHEPAPYEAEAPHPVVRSRRAPVIPAVQAARAKMVYTALEDLAPTLSECGIDLTARARAGHLDPALERDRELEALADVLGKRRANNPVLIGPPGVGKTAIVEGLALLWASGTGALQAHARRIVALDTGAMVAGTSLRGSFSERMGAIKDEVAKASGHIVVFIDELHTLIGAGASGEGPQDAAGELKAALARGDFPCIGATTEEEFKRYIERDPALERRFTPIAVHEPSCEQAQRIVRGAIAPYQAHHQVHFTTEAMDAAVLQSHRFVPERKLPDKAFAALDLAGSRARRRGASHVHRLDVAQVLHEWTGVPLERLDQADAQRFARAEGYLGKQLVGHRHVITALAQALRRGFAGFNERRPMGSFLFLGPTGVGKTEMVKVLADFVFGHRDAIVRFDMSELVEKHAVARLLGAQPGYVGYEEGGQLTEALRKRPFQIVLFDEIEKAHPEVLNVLLQILDEGHLTDTQGRRISFAHTVVILTSNLGSESALRPHAIGFGTRVTAGHSDAAQGPITEAVLQAARAALSPELWGRLDEHLVFLPLSREEMHLIALQALGTLQRRLKAEHSIELAWEDEVVPYLIAHGGYAPETGARGLRKTLARWIEAPTADLLLTGKLGPHDHVFVRVQAGSLVLETSLHQGALRARPAQTPSLHGRRSPS